MTLLLTREDHQGSPEVPAEIRDEFGGIMLPDQSVPITNASGQIVTVLDVNDPTVLVPVWPASAVSERRAIPVEKEVRKAEIVNDFPR